VISEVDARSRKMSGFSIKKDIRMVRASEWTISYKVFQEESKIVLSKYNSIKFFIDELTVEKLFPCKNPTVDISLIALTMCKKAV